MPVSGILRQNADHVKFYWIRFRLLLWLLIISCEFMQAALSLFTDLSSGTSLKDAGIALLDIYDLFTKHRNENINNF